MKTPKHSMTSRGKRSRKSQLKGKFRVDFGIVSQHRDSPELDAVRIRGGTRGRDITRKLALAKRMALEGLDDSAMARVAGVSSETMDFLRASYPDLQEAIDQGRTELDGDVIASLYQLATGTTRTVTEIHGKDASRVTYEKYFAPEMSAIKTWLNARSTKFREVARAEVTGKNGKPLIPKESRADLINSIVALVKPKPDGDDSKQERNKKSTAKK